MFPSTVSSFFFFFNDTATTEIYTLSLHDALPIWAAHDPGHLRLAAVHHALGQLVRRSEEHTSELQSPCNLVCRLLLEKKKKQDIKRVTSQTNEIHCVDSLQCHEVLSYLTSSFNSP